MENDVSSRHEKRLEQLSCFVSFRPYVYGEGMMLICFVLILILRFIHSFSDYSSSFFFLSSKKKKTINDRFNNRVIYESN